jgi:chromosome segregation ATPase
MSNVLPMTIESLVALLLLLTILYCVRLNRQLKLLKADGKTMQTTIAELMAATETAERAIAGLKTTVHEADATLGESLRSAQRYSSELHRNTAAGAEVLHRLAQVADARPWLMGVQAGPVAKPATPGPHSIAAAAGAVAERARARSKAAAA